MENQRTRLCPLERANSLDSKFRRWLQNPEKVLFPYIKEGITALDVGCGPGFFTIELAKLVGANGKVIAVDLQQGMLDKVNAKIKGTSIEERIKLVKCETDDLNVNDTVDFALAFYMVHEVLDKNKFFRQLYNTLKEGGRCLLVEPKMFHVKQKEFEATLLIAQENGFECLPAFKLFASWSALLKKI